MNRLFYCIDSGTCAKADKCEMAFKRVQAQVNKIDFQKLIPTQERMKCYKEKRMTIKAELIDAMGSDLTVANAARVSMDKHHIDFEPNDSLLLKYLAKHNHWTPFSHPQIIMRETVPIFVARQRFKHMVGFTYNEVSRRYVDSEPEFYYPEEWRERPAKNIKQGSGTVHHRTDYITKDYELLVSNALALYTQMINDGVAPEQARMVLPQSMVTQYYVTGSLAAWGRAYKLRIDSHAQKEIQELAEQWNGIISPLFPESWKALT